MTRRHSDVAAWPATLSEQIETQTLGPAALSTIVLTGRGTSSRLRAMTGALYLALQTLGRITIEEDGRPCYLAAGRWTYWCTSRSTWMQFSSRSMRSRILLLQLPAPTPSDALSQLQGERFFPTTNCVFSRTLRVFATARSSLLPEQVEAIGALLGRVALHSIEEQRIVRRAASSAHADRLERVCRYIVERLYDPQLSLDEIAAQAGCTKRYIHKIFSASGESVGQFILRRRLQAAHCALLSARLMNEPVTQIALSHGFSSPSHFSQAYRSRFGTLPSMVRRAARVARRRFE